MNGFRLYKTSFFLFLTLLAFPGSAAATESYRIGPGDVIHITVWQEQDMERTLSVPADGWVNYPLIGAVKAAGMTISQLTGELSERLGKDYLVNPQLSVEIKEYRSQKVYVLGQVKSPGLYYLRGKTGLLEMLSQSGGVLEKADKKLLLVRAGAESIKQGKKLHELLSKNEIIEVDLEALLIEGDLSLNRTLQAEDVIFIPAEKTGGDYNIYIMGAVKKPGMYEFREGLTALNACVLAGGFTEVAAPNRTDISRLNKEGRRGNLKVNLEKVQEGAAKDLPLMPGDRIFVPESYF